MTVRETISLKWKNIVVEVWDERDIKFMDELIDDLVVPFKTVKRGSDIMTMCREEDFIDLGILKVPLVYKDYCDTQGCIATVYISLPRDHPLRPLLRKAVEQTWLETVRKVEISSYGTVLYVEFTDVELEIVNAGCEVFGNPSNEETVFQVPLKTLKKNLEKAMKSKEKLLKAIEDTVKLVEEVEKQLTSKEVDLEDVEYLKKKLRQSYLSIIKPGDELDVEF